MGAIYFDMLSILVFLFYIYDVTLCSTYHIGESVKKTRCKFCSSGHDMKNFPPGNNEWEWEISTNKVNFTSRGKKGKSLIQAKDQEKEEEKDFLTLTLNEQNFRWSIPLKMGSKKTPVNLAIVTSTVISALYCSYNSTSGDEMGNVKYDVNASEDVKYVNCNSEKCTDIGQNNTCDTLENYFKLIHDFSLRKKNCTKRFCNYVNDMNFLNLKNKIDDRNMSVCSFKSTLGSDKVQGFYFEDSFDIFNNRCDYSYFGCITQADALKFNDVISGFIGLAYDNKNPTSGHVSKFPSILNTFIQKSSSKKNIFGLCFVEKGGFASFGGFNHKALTKISRLSKSKIRTKDMEGEEEGYAGMSDFDISNYITWIYYSELHKDTYKLHLKEVNMISGSETVENTLNEVAIVDSYNYFLSFPAATTAKLKAAIHKSCTGEGNICSEINDKGIFTLRKQNIENFPKIEIFFEDEEVILEPNDYIIHEGEGVYRVLINSSNVLSLGIPFFLNKYLIFDNENGKLGVSRSDCHSEVLDDDTSGVVLPPVVKNPLEQDTHLDPVEKKGFFQENKAIIMGLGALTFVGGITGGFFFFV
ncbi:aspartyl protease [Plasmodium gonderi]|uniref:Aspartyl protease n=1 Tax=Plasmodium gonderi TaxID=77519 RepID=A0A1Y1JML8_PLAGO|nr:aspartyl protease [Plasmodium gonderi]GAW83719.1 aspartyl protease [Plasmodium gonderi]